MTNLFTTRRMLRPVLFLFLFAIAAGRAGAQLTIHFSYCSATLSPIEKEKIKNYINCTDGQQPTLSISGHTGNTKGRERANQVLSEKRANAVANFVRTLPCTVDFNAVAGYGGTRPAPDAIKNKSANRRAEITLLTAEPIAIKEEYDADAALGKARFAALYQQLATPPQSFCVSPGRDTMLVGEKGTIIQIKKGDLSVSECSCVTILLNEYFDKSEMILNNLSTTSDGKQLESGGMIKIEAVCNGKLVPPAAGRSIGIMVPTDTILPGMKLFTARRDSASQILNWSGNGQLLDEVNYLNMWRWCMGVGMATPGKCPFFFCGIRSFFTNLFTSKEAKMRKAEAYNNLLNKEMALVNKYRMDTAQLLAALEKSKNNNKNIVKYYAFQNFGWGYRNCDRYRTGAEFKNLYVKEIPKDNIDAKFVEKASRSIVPAFARTKDYMFSDLAAKQPGWAIAIKLAESKIFLSMKPANSSDGSTTPEYKEVTITQLRQMVKLMDVQ